MEITEAVRRDAIEFVYANDWRVRLLIRRSVHNQLRLSQIAESVLKTCAQRNATQNTEDIQARCQAPLKDAVTFWPIVIQLLLSVIVKLLIDWFINKDKQVPPNDDELSNADVIAIYTLHEAEVNKIWAELAEANPSTTMRDAVTEWKRRQATQPQPQEPL